MFTEQTTYLSSLKSLEERWILVDNLSHIHSEEEACHSICTGGEHLQNLVIMDPVKTEPNIELSGPVEDDIDEKKSKQLPVPVVGNFFEVDVDQIKVEPSDPNCGVSAIKTEANEDPISTLAVEYGIEIHAPEMP
ncbi:uncharacterized protein [Periplaneta americana]|uniref:uncharacterized protein isoform X2 n=1 Tax=Periplaneta americana TaxID=6978 RepID=UPI0037E7D70D